MQTYWLVVSFIFGSLIGSFLNVCIYRLPRDKSICKPARSYCPHCHEPIAWHDNIPLVSYFALHGQCRHCGFTISCRYVIIEFMTAILFALTYGVMSARGESIPVTSIYMVLMAVLLMGSAIDIEFRIIPNVVTLGGAFLAPVLSVFVPKLHHAPTFGRTFLFSNDSVMGPLAASLVGMAVGAGSIWLAGVMGKLLFKRDAMGMGDVKLMAMIGGLLGWQQVMLIFFMAAFLGAGIGLIQMARTKDHHIPYGPFLSAATAITMLWGDRVFALIGISEMFR